MQTTKIESNSPAETDSAVNRGVMTRVKGGEKVDHWVVEVQENVRVSVQQKCHSVKPQWYQMMTLRKPRGIVALADPQRPCIS